MNGLAYVSGKIDVRSGACYVGDQKVDCPQEGQTLFNRPFMQSEISGPGVDKLDILPQNASLDKRNDPLFLTFFALAVLGLGALALFRVRIFGKTLGEYLKPIWYFVLIAVGVVLWQYLAGVTLEPDSLLLRISQLIWELAVALSAYKLSGIQGFGYGNMFFLGILYSLFIHGLKVSIRYFFYAKTLWYVLDRFIYGSLLVMALAFVLGSAFVYLKRKRMH